ncbi:MAG TPA: prenyltransferase/squalene oxidase repeat-containing protein [Armatimonadota bacterium]|nr:prenyltransferase/squalene oxidase repeat-containing protein [Armatimonadota bacterium]
MRRLAITTRSLLLLGALCAIAVLGLPAAAQKRASRAKPAPPAGKGKSISGTGFTLQERSGALDQDAREYLGNAKTEAAVKKALKYLAETQNADGSWGDYRYSSDVAIVGLCALSFMSAGHQPDRGPYGTVLRKAADYLAKNCQRTGLIYHPQASAGPPMYGHGFATLALAELYGMTRRTDLRDKLENAVALILRTQNQEGGWRYQPRVADADISVVICQIMALRAAANAGVKVPRETTARAIDYVKRCANNPDGGFSYMAGQRGSGQARTGAGVLSLIVMGERGSEECKRGLEYLLTKPPGTRDGHTFYALYYCTQAMYQAGGKYWQYWYPKAAEYLLSTQRADGSWYDGPGQAYATGMGVLALQVPASLLPIYQK